MASDNSTTITRLLDPKVFGTPSTVSQVVAGSSAGAGGSSQSSTSQLAQQLQQLETVAQAETETVQANTQAINQNTTQLGQGAAGTAGQVGSTVESALGLGTGLSPLLTGIAGLFSGLFGGGGGQQSVPTTFLKPPPVHVNAGMNEAAPTQPFAVDYAAGGQPRAATAGGSGSGSTQITVQVQAMDSQSFLDHSDDIAQAVRQAMLQSNVLNDVIREV